MEHQLEGRTAGQFITLVAKDRIINKFGSAANDWPEHNWWQMISTERLNITKEEIPGLMRQYKVDTLIDYERYFGDVPQENSYETVQNS